MNLIGAVIGGAIGAAIGAAIWAAVAYFTNYEVGWIAWGVGALAGAGVAFGARGQAGSAGGVVAVVLALLGIAAGKWVAVELMLHGYFESDDYSISSIADVIGAENEEAGRPSGVRWLEDAETMSDNYAPFIWEQAKSRWAVLSPDEQEQIRQVPATADPEFVKVYIANQLAEERVAKGETLQWPAGMTYDDAWRLAHFPPDIRSDAEQRWKGMSTDEQSDYRAQVIDALRQYHAAGIAQVRTAATSAGFFGSFGLFDVLWVVLAVCSAHQIGGRTLGRPASEYAGDARIGPH